MLSFLKKGMYLLFYSEKFIHYTDEVVVLKNRKLILTNAKFKKSLDTGDIFIMLSTGVWKNVEDVFSERSIPRIHKKSRKALKSSD